MTLGLLVAAIGLATLAGWQFKSPRLTTLGLGALPMAPSTALLLLALGALLAVCAGRPLGPRARRLAQSVAALGGLSALGLLGLALAGVHSSIEHLGFDAAGSVGAVPTGQMSPVVAGSLVVAACSMLLSLRGRANRGWPGLAAFGLAGLVLTSGVVFTLAYLFQGGPLLARGPFIPPAANTALALLLLGVGLLVQAREPRGAGHAPALRARAAELLVLLFGLVAAGLVSAGYFYFKGYEHQYRAETERQLLAIADLKVSELSAWRRERLGDGTVFLENENFARLVEQRAAAPGEPDLQRRLEIWLARVREAYDYERVFFLRPDGAELAAVPGPLGPTAGHLRQAAAACLRAGEISFLDLHRDGPGRPIHLSVLVPVFGAPPAGEPLGVLVLRIDPATHLYPIISRWPVPSRSAETLLVRRDGDDALFLNALRFRKDAALELRIPLTDSRVPAVRAVLGHEGVVDGVDYRGVHVLAAVRTVPGSPWAIVARIDAAEALEPITVRLWQLIAVVVSLLFGAGAAFGLVWRQEGLRFYRERFEAAEALRASERRYRTLLEHAPMAIFINRAGRVVEANAACAKLFGAASPAELVGKSPFELFHPDFHPQIRERIRTLQIRGEVVPLAEERIVRLDGATTEVEVTAAPFPDQGVNSIHVVLIDITERKRSEQALLATDRELRARNEELTRFTYTVSHDLKSPLVTIQTFLGYLEQDLEKRDAGSVAKDLAFIRTAAAKMSSLLHELLELSRVGRQMNAPEDVSLQTLADEALGAVAGRIAERRVRVTVTEQPVTVHGDRVRMVEVLQNLLDNAAKFTGERPEPAVEIGVEYRDDELAFFVRDNGAGIDPRHIPKLFGLFEKLEPASDGNGIGLALVRRIVEVHGGRVWAESEGLGCGACFWFTVPGSRLESVEGSS